MQIGYPIIKHFLLALHHPKTPVTLHLTVVPALSQWIGRRRIGREESIVVRESRDWRDKRFTGKGLQFKFRPEILEQEEQFCSREFHSFGRRKTSFFFLGGGGMNNFKTGWPVTQYCGASTVDILIHARPARFLVRNRCRISNMIYQFEKRWPDKDRFLARRACMTCIILYCSDASIFKYKNTEGAGYLEPDLIAPPHTPHNYLPKLSLSIGIDLNKLKVPPQSSLSYFRVGEAPAGPYADMPFEVYRLLFLVLESILSIDNPILFSACLYKSAIFVLESVACLMRGGGGLRARDLLTYHIRTCYPVSP